MTWGGDTRRSFRCRYPVLPAHCPAGPCATRSRKGIKILFKLPLRQTAGMVVSLLRLAGLVWSVPDLSTLCRGQKTVVVQIPYRRADGPLNAAVDNTGIKFLGDGEWQARKHGPQGRRQWRKDHLAMDPATSDIRAAEFTPSRDGPSHGLQGNHCRAADSPVLPDLLSQIPVGEQIGTVTAPSRQIATQSPAGQWMATITRAAATRPSSGVMLSRSFRSAGTDVCGRRLARRHASGTKPCAPPHTMAGPSGNTGRAISPEVGSKRNLS